MKLMMKREKKECDKLNKIVAKLDFFFRKRQRSEAISFESRSIRTAHI